MKKAPLCLVIVVVFALVLAGFKTGPMAGAAGDGNDPVGSASVSSAAPANDNFADATLLPADAGSLLAETNQEATAEVGEPNHAGLPTTPSRSVWYAWTPSATGDAYLEVTTVPYSGHYISAAVYTGPAVDALTEVASGGGPSSYKTIKLTFAVTTGTTYYVVVDGKDSSQMGAFDLTWSHDDGIYLVTKTTDSDDGACDADDCSLREAVVAANALFSVDGFITLQARTYELTLDSYLEAEHYGDLDIETDSVITILGAGRDVTVIDASRLGEDGIGSPDRVFDIAYHGTLDLSGVTVTGGRAFDTSGRGGGIRNWNGTLTISDCAFIDNFANSYGGGIASTYGSTTITNTIVSNNSTDSSYIANAGGGLYNGSYGHLRLTNTTVTSNTTNSKGHGGGIANAAVLTVTNSLISHNHAVRGGGISNAFAQETQSEEWTASVSNSVISNNFADKSSIGNGGGGIYNEKDPASFTLINSTVLDNEADGPGGGFFNNGGIVEIVDSTIVGNFADEGGWGGGIYNYSIYTWATAYVTVTNATLSGNGASYGGGIANSDRATATLANATVTGNIAGGGGGIARIGNNNATIIIANSINAGNASITAGLEDCYNVPASAGYNLFGLGTGCPAGAVGDIFTADPLLGPLAGNGGDTETHGLILGSPAIDAGDPAGCFDPRGQLLTTDQRGHPRPLDGDGDGATICDVGAYEYLLVPVPVDSVTITGPVGGEVGTALTFTATTSPISATLPISYVWQAAGQPPVNHTGGLTGTVTFTWDDPGEYMLTITATNPYDLVTGTHTVTIVDAPINGLEAGNDGPTLLGTATTLSATLASGSNVTYAWAFGDGTVGDGVTVAHTYAGPGTYTAVVTATNSANQETATTVVDVDAAITGLAVAHDGPTVLGESTSFTATVTAGSRISYAWDFGDGGSVVGPSVDHTYAAAGSYTVVVTATNSVDHQATTTTVLVEEAIAGLSAVNDGPTTLGEGTHFTATVTAGSHVVYAWDFGDGESDVGPSVDHTYAAPGTYTVTVTATNPVSELTTTTKVTVIGTSYTIFLPLVIRP